MRWEWKGVKEKGIVRGDYFPKLWLLAGLPKSF